MVDELIKYLEGKAQDFGAKNIDESSKDYILRKNIKAEAFKNNGAYFGFIHPTEETSGPYHDFSFVVFPSENDDNWVICLGIGSLGFRNDFELATFPGVRRLFSKIISNEGSFCKTDFSDIETSLPRSFLQNQNISSIRKTLETYKKVLPVCQIIEKPNLNNSASLEIMEEFLAAYAKLRNWATNKSHRQAISKSINKIKTTSSNININEVKKILEQRKYIVLEGAPGTGKTRMAQIVADEINAITLFTQFHAETTYSDFIWGLRPKLNSEEIIYEEVKGEFIKAIQFANEDHKRKVILIIDEINRANLSNILGPIFYLFEYNRVTSNVEIDITPNLRIKELPNNLYVIATMNTADRSLAVVDFALRRRFAWITLKPEKISSVELSNSKFFEKDFEKFNDIFDWYASSNELSLQPGQAYFIATNDAEMENRIIYELYPLIKEYLQEGIMIAAKEEFNLYFQSRIQKSLFE